MLDYGDVHADPPTIIYALPPSLEEMVLPSAIGLSNHGFAPVVALRVSNRLSKSKRGVLRDADPYELDSWILAMLDLKELEIFSFPLNFLESFAGDKGRQRSPLAAKDVTFTVYPAECGDFWEPKTWVKARAEARLPFERLEVSLDYSIPATPPVDENFIDSLRSSLAEHVLKDVVVQVLCSPQ